jgi:hypothetical protein
MSTKKRSPSPSPRGAEIARSAPWGRSRKIAEALSRSFARVEHQLATQEALRSFRLRVVLRKGAALVRVKFPRNLRCQGVALKRMKLFAFFGAISRYAFVEGGDRSARPLFYQLVLLEAPRSGFLARGNSHAHCRKSVICGKDDLLVTQIGDDVPAANDVALLNWRGVRRATSAKRMVMARARIINSLFQDTSSNA